MTNAMLASYLTILAQLVEAQAKTAAEAAAIIREQAEFLKNSPEDTEEEE